MQPFAVPEHGLHGPAAMVSRRRSGRVRTAGRRRSGGTREPLVEPGQADPEQQTGDRVWHPMVGPLVGDEACHAHFVASFTHRTTERLRTSRSIGAPRSRHATASAPRVVLRQTLRSPPRLAARSPSCPGSPRSPQGRERPAAIGFLPSPRRSGPLPHGTPVVLRSASLASCCTLEPMPPRIREPHLDGLGLKVVGQQLGGAHGVAIGIPRVDVAYCGVRQKESHHRQTYEALRTCGGWGCDTPGEAGVLR